MENKPERKMKHLYLLSISPPSHPFFRIYKIWYTDALYYRLKQLSAKRKAKQDFTVYFLHILQKFVQEQSFAKTLYLTDIHALKETSAFQTFCQDYEFWVETDSKQPPENCILCEKQSIDGRQLDNLYLNLQKAA